MLKQCLTISKIEVIKSLNATTRLVIRDRREGRFLLLDIVY